MNIHGGNKAVSVSSSDGSNDYIPQALIDDPVDTLKTSTPPRKQVQDFKSAKRHVSDSMIADHYLNAPRLDMSYSRQKTKEMIFLNWYTKDTSHLEKYSGT